MMTGRLNGLWRSTGTSLRECTARSALPSSRAVSSSLTNSPLPPTLDSVRSRIWSPRVVISSSSTRQPGYRAWRRDCTWRACHNARRLARVAITRCWGAEAAVMRYTSIATGEATGPVQPEWPGLAAGWDVSISWHGPCVGRCAPAQPGAQAHDEQRAEDLGKQAGGFRQSAQPGGQGGVGDQHP